MSEVHGVGGPMTPSRRAELERQLAEIASKEFGERYRDAIEAGAQWLRAHHGQMIQDYGADAYEDAEAILLAATIEIACGRCHGEGCVMNYDAEEVDCPDCRGSAVLRVLPTTEEG